jgi:hypothetical protein
VVTEPDVRPLPEAIATTLCEGCGNPVVWAITVAGPNGRGGKLMPLDPHENLAGNVAVTAPHRGRLLARVLTKGEDFDRPFEHAGMTHFASCPTGTKPALPADVVALQELRHRPRRRGGRHR